MSVGVNKVILVGNVGKTPEVKTLNSGTKVAHFSLAVSRRVKGNDGNYTDQTTWIPVSAWGSMAEVVEKYVSQGSQLFIEGRIDIRQYEKDGQKRTATEVVASTLNLLGKKQDSNKAQGTPYGQQQGNPYGQQQGNPYGQATTTMSPEAARSADNITRQGQAQYQQYLQQQQNQQQTQQNQEFPF